MSYGKIYDTTWWGNPQKDGWGGVYYDLANPYLLNQFGGAAAAYSLRQLSSDTTNVVKVRRDSDNAEQDFTAAEITDGTLATFVGSGNNGYVTTWYDQSGNGNDAIQTTASSQPKIYDSSTGLVLENGKPAILPDGVDDYFAISYQTLKSIFIVAEPETFPNGVIGGYISTVFNLFAYRSNAFDTHNFPLKTTQSLWSAFAIGSADPRDIYAYRDGVASVDNPKSLNLITDCVTIFSRSGSINGPYSKKAQEIIIYPSDQSANRENIEGLINSYYSIYP